MDVNAIDLTGIGPSGDRAELERLAAGNVKRTFVQPDEWTKEPTLSRLKASVEIKTVWHPLGV
jgi:hypothetical protein